MTEGIENYVSNQAFAAEMLAELRKTPDLPFNIAQSIRDGRYADETVIDLALIHAAMVAPLRIFEEMVYLDPIDFKWAVDFLDYLTAFRLSISRRPARKKNESKP